MKKKFEEPKWPQIFKESIKAFETAEKAAKKLDVKDNQGRSYISFTIKGKKAVMIHANDIDFQTKSGVICFIAVINSFPLGTGILAQERTNTSAFIKS